MSPNAVATLTLIVPRTPSFRVTPKGRTAADRGRVEPPPLLRLVLGTSFVAAVVYALHLLGALDRGYTSDWAALGAFGWLAVNAGLVWLAIRRVRSMRFAAERRSAVRFSVDVPGWVDGAPATVRDVSVGGALVATRDRLVERESHLVSIELPNGTTSLWAAIRSSRRAPSGEFHCALEFEPGQYPSCAALARAVFAGRYPVSGVVRRPWPELLRRELSDLSDRVRLSGAERPATVVPLPAGIDLPPASA